MYQVIVRYVDNKRDVKVTTNKGNYQCFTSNQQKFVRLGLKETLYTVVYESHDQREAVKFCEGLKMCYDARQVNRIVQDVQSSVYL